MNRQVHTDITTGGNNTKRFAISFVVQSSHFETTKLRCRLLWVFAAVGVFWVPSSIA